MSSYSPEVEARLKLWYDYESYARYCLKIQTEDGRLVPFEFNEVQKLLHEIIKDIRKNNRLIRCIILKARREGVSTWVTGRFYWKTSMNKNRYAMIIAHEPEAKDFLFNMVKRYHNHCPEEFKPEDKYNNKAILEFNNATGTGLDSAIRVGCAGKEDFGSGMKIDFLHISELSKWDKNVATPLLTSVMQTVPNENSSEIIIESTAKGIGGEFYDRYWKAKYRYDIYLDENNKPAFKCTINPRADAFNEFHAIFIPYFVFEKYKLPVSEDFKLTDEEIQLKELYNLSDEHLVWRRWCIANRCNGSVDIFKQEYPMNDIEAFLSSGASLFDSNKLLELKKNAPKPINRYEINIGLKEVIPNPEGRLKVWEEPNANKKYILSADISEGIISDTSDYSCIDVIDWHTGIQVAQWHGKISPDLLAVIIYVIGRRYNWALAAVERNSFGLLVINKLLDDNYPEIYVETQYEPPHKPKKKYGWTTSKTTKPVIIGNLMAEFSSDTHGIKCAETFEEMLTFKQTEDGQFEAEHGHFDDRVMSIAIAKYIRTIMPLKELKSQRSIITLRSKKVNDFKMECF